MHRERQRKETLEASRQLRVQKGVERLGLGVLPGGLGQDGAGAIWASETPGTRILLQSLWACRAFTGCGPELSSHGPRNLHLSKETEVLTGVPLAQDPQPRTSQLLSRLNRDPPAPCPPEGQTPHATRNLLGPHAQRTQRPREGRTGSWSHTWGQAGPHWALLSAGQGALAAFTMTTARPTPLTSLPSLSGVRMCPATGHTAGQRALLVLLWRKWPLRGPALVGLSSCGWSSRLGEAGVDVMTSVFKAVTSACSKSIWPG